MSRAEGRLIDERFRRFIETVLAKPGESRALYAGLGQGFEPPPGTVAEPMEEGRVRGEWVRTPASRPDMAILYLHGGGYTTGSAMAYRHLTGAIAALTGATILSLDYALAPECPFPHGLEDAVAAWRLLIARGFRADRIAVAGDSAGAGLALALMLSLRALGQEQPAAAWLMSPLADLERTGETHRLKAEVDPIHLPGVTAASAERYLAGASIRDPLASPVHADLAGLPPLRIDVGSHETLLDDSLRLARNAALADVEIELRVWPAMVHIFPFFFPMLEEGRAAIEGAAVFMERHCGARWPGPTKPKTGR